VKFSNKNYDVIGVFRGDRGKQKCSLRACSWQYYRSLYIDLRIQILLKKHLEYDKLIILAILATETVFRAPVGKFSYRTPAFLYRHIFKTAM
jgi:hypothetical protein